MSAVTAPGAVSRAPTPPPIPPSAPPFATGASIARQLAGSIPSPDPKSEVPVMKERSGVCDGVCDVETTLALHGDTTDVTAEAPRAAPGAAALFFASMSLNAVGVACFASL